MIVTKEINVTGMQCSGCEVIIEEALLQIDGIIFAKADFLKATVKVSFDPGKTSLANIQEACKAKGYIFKSPGNSKRQKISKFIFSLLAFAGLITVLIIARRFGHQPAFPEINSQTSYGLIFIAGLLTGLHCIGMCGSFLIGYTVKDAEQNRSLFRSHLLYGAGKTLSYTMFGAIFGLLGSLVRINPIISGLSLGLAGAFLILYGLNLLNILPSLKVIRIKLPVAISQFVTKRRRRSRSPFYIGFFSGFILGCGPLQLMYVLAAGYGNALEGAKILALFGLGTLPALLGFGLLVRMLSNTMTRRVVHASGIILIVLGSVMLNKGIIRSASANDLKRVHSCCHEPVVKE
jgi:sulfite exporter TauE/SafE/copper chaperone CopZ